MRYTPRTSPFAARVPSVSLRENYRKGSVESGIMGTGKFSNFYSSIGSVIPFEEKVATLGESKLNESCGEMGARRRRSRSKQRSMARRNNSMTSFDLSFSKTPCQLNFDDVSDVSDFAPIDKDTFYHEIKLAIGEDKFNVL